MTLKTEIQSRIDALTYPIDATVLLQNAVDTVSHDLDLTNIISVYQQADAATTGATTADEITSLTATSIALGITSKSAGGGSEIGDFKGLNVNDVNGLYINALGEEWLRHGVIETDLASYPDAKQTLTTEAGYKTSDGFSSSSQSVAADSIEWDGTHFWVLDWQGTNSVYQYTAEGVYTGVTHVTAASTPRGLAWDGTHFWVFGADQNKIHKYDASWAFVSTTNMPINIYGGCFDGTHLWMINRGSNTLDKYDLNLVAQGVSYAYTPLLPTAASVCFNDGFFYIPWTSTMHILEADGTPRPDLSFPIAASSGATAKDAEVWSIGGDIVSKNMAIVVTTHVGIASQDTDASTNLPMYMRIK